VTVRQPGSTETGSGHPMVLVAPDGPTGVPCRVLATRTGLELRPVAGRPPRGRTAAAPIRRIPWHAVRGFNADGTAPGPDGRLFQQLEVVCRGEVVTLLAPAPVVAGFVADVAGWSERWAHDRHPLHVAVAEAATALGSRSHRLLRPVGRAAFRSATAVLLALVGVAQVLRGAGRAAAARGSALADRARGPATDGAGAFALWSRATVRLVWLVSDALVRPCVRAAGVALRPVGRRVVGAGRTLWRWTAATGRLVWFVGCSLVLPVLRPLARTDRAQAVVAAAERFRDGVTDALHVPNFNPDEGVEVHWGPVRQTVAPLLAAGTSLVLILGGTAALAYAGAAASGAPRPVHGAAFAAAQGNDGFDTSAMAHMIGSTPSRLPKSMNLTPATAPPAPAPPSLVDAPPLQPHEVFGFAPYWTLPDSSGFDVEGLTTLAYFSIGVNADGSLDESGAGWNGYQSQALADLVTRAHAADDRVVLTVNCFDQGTLNALTSSLSAPATLSTALVSAIEAKNLDGVNIDFEGEGSGDQDGLTNLIGQVSAALHAVNPHWQVTMDTYASSAGDPNGFYNIQALAPYVNGFFVMAYQLNLQATPQSASPLTSSMFSDLTTAEQYSAVVDPSKVILGLPYYGYDWPTTDGTLDAQATGAPSTVTYSQVMASGNPVYWDNVTDTAWSSYLVGQQWHEQFVEDPTSLYLVAEMAQFFHLDGVGIWALGMDGNDPEMLAALDGFAPPAKNTAVGPTATPPSVPGSGTTVTAPGGASYGVAGSGSIASIGSPSSTTTSTSTTTTTTTTAPPSPYRYSGNFDGQEVSLTKLVVAPSSVPQFVGTLSWFETTNPDLTCLEADADLDVWQYAADPSAYVVVASRPSNCTDADFSFPAPTAVATGGSSGNGSPSADAP
jgi:hypothetical protein